MNEQKLWDELADTRGILAEAYDMCQKAANIIVMAAPEEAASKESNNPLSAYVAEWASLKPRLREILNRQPT